MHRPMSDLVKDGLRVLDSYLTETFSYLYKVATEKGVDTTFGWKGEKEPFDEDYEDCEQFEKDSNECEKWKIFFVLGQDYTQRCRVVTGITYRLYDGGVDVTRTYKFFECEIVDEGEYPESPASMWYGNFEGLLQLAGLIAEELGVKI